MTYILTKTPEQLKHSTTVVIGALPWSSLVLGKIHIAIAVNTPVPLAVLAVNHPGFDEAPNLGGQIEIFAA
jgi:hypothetical protein